MAKIQKVPKNEGFSLIELLIAIFFISIVLVAIASGMVKVAQSLWETKARSIAVNMAQNCIEDINFANKYTSWYNFFNDTNDVITGSCLEEATGLSEGSFELASVGIVQKENGYLCSEDLNDATKVTCQEPLSAMKREFIDESIQTKFNFLVEVHRATQKYARPGMPGEISSQVVVVLMTVTWDKYYSTTGATQRNTYTVTKQYLQPSTY